MSRSNNVLCYKLVSLGPDSSHCWPFRLRRNTEDSNTIKRSFSYDEVCDVDPVPGQSKCSVLCQVNTLFKA